MASAFDWSPGGCCCGKEPGPYVVWEAPGYPPNGVDSRFNSPNKIVRLPAIWALDGLQSTLNANSDNGKQWSIPSGEDATANAPYCVQGYGSPNNLWSIETRGGVDKIILYDAVTQTEKHVFGTESVEIRYLIGAPSVQPILGSPGSRTSANTLPLTICGGDAWFVRHLGESVATGPNAYAYISRYVGFAQPGGGLRPTFWYGPDALHGSLIERRYDGSVVKASGIAAQRITKTVLRNTPEIANYSHDYPVVCAVAPRYYPKAAGAMGSGPTYFNGYPAIQQSMQIPVRQRIAIGDITTEGNVLKVAADFTINKDQIIDYTYAPGVGNTDLTHYWNSKNARVVYFDAAPKSDGSGGYTWAVYFLYDQFVIASTYGGVNQYTTKTRHALWVDGVEVWDRPYLSASGNTLLHCAMPHETLGGGYVITAGKLWLTPPTESHPDGTLVDPARPYGHIIYKNGVEAWRTPPSSGPCLTGYSNDRWLWIYWGEGKESTFTNGRFGNTATGNGGFLCSHDGVERMPIGRFTAQNNFMNPIAPGGVYSYPFLADNSIGEGLVNMETVLYSASVDYTLPATVDEVIALRGTF